MTQLHLHCVEERFFKTLKSDWNDTYILKFCLVMHF